MGKNENLAADLEQTVATTEATDATPRSRKEQSAEEKETLVAGAEKLIALGVSSKLANVLTLAIDWNTDKETVTAAKEALIKEFGSSDNLKDYVDGEFQKEILPFQGIAKLMPVLNNIKSFYARRENSGSKKVKFVQVSISGTIYNVDSAYSAEISHLTPTERKQLLLAHASTTKVDVAEEIF